MQYRLISDTGAGRLILFFAGWGMDERPFEGLTRPGYDIAVVWDYRDTLCDMSFTRRYSEICLVAWSLGVGVAATLGDTFDNKITKRIAINGTIRPVDEHLGIPPAIYLGTRNGLNERNLTKFYRRMCLSRTDFATFDARRPRRDIEELKHELDAVHHLTSTATRLQTAWDLAIVSESDAIFPPDNQLAAWHTLGVPVRRIGEGHLPDFQRLLDSEIIDKDLMRDNFATRRPTYDGDSPAQQEICCRMARLIADMVPADYTGNILEIGSGSGLLTRRLMAACPQAHFDLWDISGLPPAGLPDGIRYDFASVDAETAIAEAAPGSHRYIFSASTMQWFNSPQRFFENCARALAADGMMLISTFLPDNLMEMSRISGKKLPLYEAGVLLSLASRHFKVLRSEDFRLTLRFITPLEAMRHLRNTGVNSLGRTSGEPVNTRRLLDEWPRDTDGLYPLTYHPFIMLLKKNV